MLEVAVFSDILLRNVIYLLRKCDIIPLCGIVIYWPAANEKSPGRPGGFLAKGIRKKRGRKEDSTEGRQSAHGFRLPSEHIITPAFEHNITKI